VFGISLIRESPDSLKTTYANWNRAFFPTPPKGLKSQGEPVWYFYLAEIALRRLGNRILNHIYQNGSTAASSSDIDDAIPNFEDQADGWYDISHVEFDNILMRVTG